MLAEISVKEVEQCCANELKKAGYKTAGSVAFMRIDEMTHGWVGFNVSKHSEFVRVNPNIGIHCTPVMRCLDEIRGRKYQIGRLATYSVPLGTILPEERQIVITEPSEMNAEIRRMISYIEGDGEVYMRRLADLTVLEQALFRSVGQLGGYPEKYALTLLVSGKIREFHEFSAKQLALYQSNGDTEEAAEWTNFERQAEPCVRNALQSK
ncbi:hypothetical protein SAMN05518865_110126 [Duganella sp. CF458]|uniref:hypothetical protein n=1 Tax=Duganella sp. CF458 TaxID=1884368 RepID=UPI0008EE521D|nr:hypothetical protein [Duganella sp. CF458]SFG28392.1 hypothetical protein SAMN05518865_110126 [Duganella sp. CF458]